MTPRNRPPGIFIVGSGTGVGKTAVTAAIARQLVTEGIRIGVYKPVASGCHSVDGTLVSDDALALWEAAGKPGTLDEVCPQKFAAPLAPHLSAQAEGKEVDARLLREGAKAWYERCDVLLIEGAGGLMSPLTDEEYVADLALDLGYPLVVVVPNQLGVIHSALTTLIAATTFQNGLPVAGLVLNHPHPVDLLADPSQSSNQSELEKRCVPPVLTTLGHGESKFATSVNWRALAEAPA
jgi:dethiobiotin synthetase